jgi:hypothetical protein
MAIDPDLVALTSANLLTGTAAGHLRRERFADAAASGIIAGMNHVLEKGRQTFSMLSDMLVVNNANSLDNQDLAEVILAQRSAQFQPQEATMVDPNYRQPPPPPVQSGIKAT